MTLANARPPRGPIFALLVPRPGLQHGILPRSAIVRASRDDTRTLVYYEGNAFGASDMKHYSVRVLHAADRARQYYPTVALGSYLHGEMIEVGTYDARTQRITSITDPTALAAWLDGETLPAVWDESDRAGYIFRVMRQFGLVEETALDAMRCVSRWTGKFEDRAGTLYAQCAPLAPVYEPEEWLPVARTIYVPKQLAWGALHQQRAAEQHGTAPEFA